MANQWDRAASGDKFRPNADAHNLFLDVAKTVLRSRPAADFDPSRFDQFAWYYAKTTSALSAGSFSSPTTCTFNAWEVNEASGSSPKPLIVSTNAELLGQTIENYWNIVVPSGTQIAVKRDYLGKWSILWADC